MIKLVLGLILWWSAHLLKRVAPALRRDLSMAVGEKASRGVIAIVLFASVFLIVIGYRQADFVPVYTPLPAIGFLADIMLLVSLFMVGIGPVGGRLSARFRHPMLWGVFIWAVAHLLVNGDLASLVLFAGFALWALVQIRLINQHEGPWERPMPGNSLQDWKLFLSVLFAYCVIAGIHWLFGLNPFAGTYT